MGAPTPKNPEFETLVRASFAYAIYNAQQYFQSACIVVGMLAIGIAWLMTDRLILRPIESRTIMRWGIMRD